MAVRRLQPNPYLQDFVASRRHRRRPREPACVCTIFAHTNQRLLKQSCGRQLLAHQLASKEKPLRAPTAEYNVVPALSHPFYLSLPLIPLHSAEAKLQPFPLQSSKAGHKLRFRFSREPLPQAVLARHEREEAAHASGPQQRCHVEMAKYAEKRIPVKRHAAHHHRRRIRALLCCSGRDGSHNEPGRNGRRRSRRSITIVHKGEDL